MPDASLCINGNNRDNAHITGSPLQRHGEADPYRSLGHSLRAAVLLHRTRIADGDSLELYTLHNRPAIVHAGILCQLFRADRPFPVRQASLEILSVQCRVDRFRDGSRASDIRTAPASQMGASEAGKRMAGDSRLLYGERHAVYAGRELEKSRAEAELQNLKSQLNPHFLFNTLNNIYSLIAFSPERAQEAVHDLSRLLRYVLYDSSQPMVPLEKELDFIRNYVELMRIRLPEHVKLTTDISAATPETQVAPLLFISLIENAFKHGVSHNKPSFIDLKIHQEGTRIVCSIRNSDFPKDNGQDKSGSGIGLQNLSRRLELLYPSHHIFTYGQKGDEYVCLLELQA